MKKIPLSAKRKPSNRGKFFATVDAELYDELNKYHWSISKNGYAQRRVKIGDKVSTILMHRQIMELSFGDSIYVDHKNGNRLDNRKSNLRICSRTENNHNMRISKRNKSGAKGVFLLTIEYETKKAFLVKIIGAQALWLIRKTFISVVFQTQKKVLNKRKRLTMTLPKNITENLPILILDFEFDKKISN